MIMKMHSYITLNWQLQSVAEQSQELFVSLKQKTKAVGGLDKAIADAIAKQTEFASIASASLANGSSTHEPTPIGTPPVSEGSSTAYVDASTASALRQRLTSLPSSDKQHPSLMAEVDVVHPHISQDRSRLETLVNDGSPERLGPHPLIHHPDPEISAIAKGYSEMRFELTSSGPHPVTWPNNISWKNFAVYQLIPTLVYDLEYPCTDR